MDENRIRTILDDLVDAVVDAVREHDSLHERYRRNGNTAELIEVAQWHIQKENELVAEAVKEIMKLKKSKSYLATAVECKGCGYAQGFEVKSSDDIVKLLKSDNYVYANICTSKSEMNSKVDAWNEMYKTNGNSLYV